MLFDDYLFVVLCNKLLKFIIKYCVSFLMSYGNKYDGFFGKNVMELGKGKEVCKVDSNVVKDNDDLD